MSEGFDGRPCVLVVDDDAGLRGLLWHQLRSLGYAALLAPCGAEAVRTYARHAGDVALALVDVRMRGGDGPDTLAALRQLDPGLPCCFITSDPGHYTQADLLALGALAVLHKPFSQADLARVLSGAVHGAGQPA
jgi:CheY-like chemotaxis protein